MIIEISPKYRITSDSRQWRIEQHFNRKDPNVSPWAAFAFFPRFEQAVESIGNRLIRESTAEGLAECTKAIKDIATALSLALPAEYKLLSIEHIVELEKPEQNKLTEELNNAV